MQSESGVCLASKQHFFLVASHGRVVILWIWIEGSCWYFSGNTDGCWVLFHIAPGNGVISNLGSLWTSRGKMKIAFFRVVTVLIGVKKTVGEWDAFSYKKLWCGFFCFMFLLTLHGQVNFIDSCTFNVERWVEFLGRSEGKVLLTTIFQLVLKQPSKPLSPWHHWLCREQHTVISHGLFMPASKKIYYFKITCPCSDLCVWDGFILKYTEHSLPAPVQEFSWLWHKQHG